MPLLIGSVHGAISLDAAQQFQATNRKINTK